jgi:hypothetical protein
MPVIPGQKAVPGQPGIQERRGEERREGEGREGRRELREPASKKKKKNASRVAQVVQCLPDKHEALSSDSNTTKKGRKKKKKKTPKSHTQFNPQHAKENMFLNYTTASLPSQERNKVGKETNANITKSNTKTMGVNENIMERVNLFKVHCIHIWNYHNEIPLYY